MSDYRAIAGVSSTLKRLLEDRMDSPVAVTIAPPDVSLSEVSGHRLNLYLYQVSENGYLKNQEIPGHGHPGAYGHPPLSLELYYLLTAFSESEAVPDADLQAQQVLGDGMRVLHDHAIITPGLHQADDPAQPPILDPTLLGEFERIKVALQPASLEELSKIWTALPQANFRRSVVYQVSVVQIESQRPRRYPRLVGELPAAGPRVHVLPFRAPAIRELRVLWQGDPSMVERAVPYARMGDSVILLGRNLAGETTRVIAGSVDLTGQITSLRDDRIAVTIPDEVALQPGAQPVRVVRDVELGDPPQPHLAFESNIAVLILVPRIDGLDDTTTAGKLTITGSRLFHPDLESLTLVGDAAVHSSDYTAKTPASITFDVPAGLSPGAHAVRVRVNGTESIDQTALVIP